jgi:ATP phosphoribosyltransferase
MMVCGSPGSYPPSAVRRGGRTLRVGTKFPNIASTRTSAEGLPVEVIFVQGSVELAPLTGLADVIVDLVETGETLAERPRERRAPRAGRRAPSYRCLARAL